jgi:putative peptidoglycan lipid II flippase
LIFTDSIGVFTIPLGYLLGSIGQFIILLVKLTKKDRIAIKKLKMNPEEFGFLNKNLLIIIFIEIINQLYILIDRYFYGNVDPGGIAALNYANVLFTLPISIFSLALATAIFPKLSQAFNAKDYSSIQNQVFNGIKINIFLFIPITIIFILYGDSILRIIYERGNFSVQDTEMTFKILRIYAISLIFYSSYAVLNKVIYGGGLINYLLFISFGAFLLKSVLNVILVEKFKQDGLALSTSLSYIVLSLSGYLILYKKLKLRKTYLYVCTGGFYILNALTAYCILKILKPILNFPTIFNSLINISIFISVYLIGLLIIKPNEYKIFRDSIIKTFPK